MFLTLPAVVANGGEPQLARVLLAVGLRLARVLLAVVGANRMAVGHYSPLPFS